MQLTPEQRPAPPRPAPRRRRRRTSPLTLRILAVNLLAPVVLVVGLLYLDRYREELVNAELAALRTRAEMVAVAIGEGAVRESALVAGELDLFAAQQMLRRLAQPAGARARLFGPDGALVADSRLLGGGSGVVTVEDLAPPDARDLAHLVRSVHDALFSWIPTRSPAPAPYVEAAEQRAADYPEAVRALAGDTATAMRSDPGRGLILSAAVPAQRYKRVVGAVMLTTGGEPVAEALFQVRLAILQVFAFALSVTVLVSFYLAGTIARPIRRLAVAAERVRRGHGRRPQIPDLSRRGDEIGELSRSLREMTEALWQRMDATEAFAADVAHEIKNPLTSLRSAVETVARVPEGEQRRLMAIIADDVQRLDRLISDISDASRLDAELSRAEAQPVEMRGMLETLAEVYRATAQGVRFELALPAEDPLATQGIEGRLVQVFRNLIANAITFSPAGGTIRLAGSRDDDWLELTVEDEGPGIPVTKLEAIFQRFYSERPSGEKFGTHSGLGLSISQQIVDAHGGSITAANRRRPDGGVCGARFTVVLPAG